MKKRLLAAAVAVALMIGIPLLTVKNNTFNDIKLYFNSKEEIKANPLTEITAYHFKKSYCDEGLKAIAIILNSNYKSKIKQKRMSKNDFIKKFGNDYYSKIEKTVAETKNIFIAYKGKPARIPCCYISSGVCEIDYPYIRKTSSPWDLLNAEYKSGLKPEVSLNSINEMCESGLSYKEALGRYLQNVKITAS